MKYHQKKIRKAINAWQAFGTISFALLVGVIFAVSIGFSRELSDGREVLAFIGMTLLMTLLGGAPAAVAVSFVLSVYYHTADDLYLTAWDDGVRDQPEVLAERARQDRPS